MSIGRLALIVLLACSAGAAFAAVPPMISYQGKLMQPSGAPVPDGRYSLRFAIYDAPTAGNTLWSEPNDAVQVKGGLFSVLLGSLINMPANIFDNPDRFFGVKVGSDPEMTPRQRIASVGYAVKAGAADLAAAVPDGAIGRVKIADGAVTASKVADGSITADKLAPGVGVPAGSVVQFAGSAAPDGWLLCDGSAVSRPSYSALFAAIGVTYGGGDGSTTFNLPDLRQRFPLGKAVSGTGSVLGQMGGSIDHFHKGYGADGGDLRAAIGSCNNDASTLGFIRVSAIDPNTGQGADPGYVVSGTGFSNGGGTFNHYTVVFGRTGAANPPYLVVNYIIKY